MSYVYNGFVARYPLRSQSTFYNNDNKKAVSFGGTYKCPLNTAQTVYGTFRGNTGVRVLGEYVPETSKFAYIVDDYKISWSSDVMSYGTSDFDCYLLQMRICTFKIIASSSVSVLQTHEYVVLNTLPNQVVTYEGKLPVAIPVNPGEGLGVVFIGRHVLGSEDTISTATFNMVCHLTIVDDGDYVKPNPYPW